MNESSAPVVSVVGRLTSKTLEERKMHPCGWRFVLDSAVVVVARCFLLDRSLIHWSLVCAPCDYFSAVALTDLLYTKNQTPQGASVRRWINESVREDSYRE